jgi:tRNA(Ile2) C34 agmatinyltransferase TiaS
MDSRYIICFSCGKFLKSIGKNKYQCGGCGKIIEMDDTDADTPHPDGCLHMEGLYDECGC